MSSLIDNKNPGIFDPAKRYAFTNITEEDFEARWNGETVMVVKPNQTVELPHHLANKFVDEMVDMIMTGQAKMDEVAMLKKNPSNPLPRSPKGMSLGVPAVRKVFEDQIVKEIEVDPDSPEVRLMRSQVREQLMNDIAVSKEKTAPISSINMAPTEFADLTGKSGK